MRYMIMLPPAAEFIRQFSHIPAGRWPWHIPLKEYSIAGWTWNFDKKTDCNTAG